MASVNGTRTSASDDTKTSAMSENIVPEQNTEKNFLKIVTIKQ